MRHIVNTSNEGYGGDELYVIWLKENQVEA
jgi:hypothetical protein